MENKISVSLLASSLAQTTGKTKKLCEDFIREFFRIVTDSLDSGESLKIKGFGTFKITEHDARSSVNVNTGEKYEIAPYKKVVFTPAKELASKINAPFEDFDSIEIEDDIPDEILFDATLEEPDSKVEEICDDKSLSLPVDEENQIQEGIIEAGSDEEAEDDEITYEAYHEEIETPSNENRIKVPILEEGSEEEAGDDEFTYAAYDSIEKVEQRPAFIKEDDELTEKDSNLFRNFENQKNMKNRFGMGFLTGALSAAFVCVVVFMIGCFLDWWPVNFGRVPNIVNEQPIAQEEPQGLEEGEVPVTNNQEEEPVYDTVSTTRYLTTIAREHYGDFNFWPYIYKENESILGHPDRITPGTKVVVPALSKYGVDPTNKEDVAKAKKLGLEIYSKYR